MKGDAFTLDCRGIAIGWNDEPVHVQIDGPVDLAEIGHRLPILGPSGAGKSTLLYVIAGLKRPMAGRVVWRLPFGPPIVFEPGAGRPGILHGGRFGFALQDAPLLPHLTVEENLRLPLTLRGRSAATGHVEATLADVLFGDEDPDALRSALPGELSGGQRRRVALAQAMISDPTVLFADEPGGALDRDTRYNILQVVDRWVEAGIRNATPRAFVWITHHDDGVELGRSRGHLEVHRVEKTLIVEQKRTRSLDP